jgi:hypothetical protein
MATTAHHRAFILLKAFLAAHDQQGLIATLITMRELSLWLVLWFDAVAGITCQASANPAGLRRHRFDHRHLTYPGVYLGALLARNWQNGQRKRRTKNAQRHRQLSSR